MRAENAWAGCEGVRIPYAPFTKLADFIRLPIIAYMIIVFGLLVVMALVLTLPFFSKRIEEELESFLFIMGLLSVTISGLWSLDLAKSMVKEPVEITLAVFIAGLVFKFVRVRLHSITHRLVGFFGFRPVIFILIAVLGLISSVITAIIAALVLSEIVSSLKVSHSSKIRITVIGCYAIGLGAVLTPLGEPLATIAIAKLKGPPLEAGFFFLFYLLAIWVIPLVGALGVFAVLFTPEHTGDELPAHGKGETFRDVVKRAVRVYLFVMALVLLGRGISPLVDKYVVHIHAYGLYWINMISAVLDNATLAAAEISPKMPTEMIRDLLLGLLISGGMLIPGNIPNIVCASKLKIKSSEWARIGLPLGLILMALCFGLLILSNYFGA